MALILLHVRPHGFPGAISDRHIALGFSRSDIDLMIVEALADDVGEELLDSADPFTTGPPAGSTMAFGA